MTTIQLIKSYENGAAEMVTISSADSARSVSDGLPHIGCGISRDVYGLSEAHVLKVQNGCNYGVHTTANANEVALWEAMTKEEQDSGIFARIFAWADDYSWLIMERIPYIGSRGDISELGREVISKFRAGDQHDENYGSREDGSHAIIDYGLNSEVSDDFCDGWSDPEPCECCACDCSDCWPDGCQCGTLEGCNRKTCEMCGDEVLRLRAAARSHITWGWAAPGVGRIHPQTLPTAVRARLRREADHARRFASDGCTIRTLNDSFNCDTRKAVCRNHANELDGLNQGNDDSEQLELIFPNRFCVGAEWHGAYRQPNGREGWGSGAVWISKAYLAYGVRDRWTGELVRMCGRSFKLAEVIADHANHYGNVRVFGCSVCDEVAKA